MSVQGYRKQKENFFKNPQALHSSLYKKWLRYVLSHCCFSQHQRLEALLLGDQGSLSRLRDMADTFHFASSTSGEDDCVSQRHTRGHLTELQACSTDTLSTSRAPLPPSCRCLDPGPLAHQQIQHGVCCHRHVQTPHTLCFGEIWTLTAQQLAPGTWAVTSAALQPPAWSSSLTSLTLAPNSCFSGRTLFLPQELH